MKKKIYSFALMAVMALSGGILFACNNTNNQPEKLAYVSLDINPAIELIVDKTNKVVSVRGENEDGQVLLYQETGIKGEKIETAVDKITDLAVKYGYINEDNKVVDIIVTSGDNKFANDILNKVNSSITVTADNLGININTDGEGTYSLLRKMDEIKKQFPNNAVIQNMSVQKFKLALSVSETGDISFEAAIKLDDAKLIEMLKNESLKIEEFATEAYNEVKTNALSAYEKLAEIAEYSVYTKYYLENILSHPTTAYYGGAYQMYASAAKGFESICDVAELAVKKSNYPLTQEQINVVKDIFGLEDTSVLENSNGDITIASIESYADVLFKNTSMSESLQQTKENLSNALSEIEIVLEQEANRIFQEYRPQIEEAMASARQMVDAVEDTLNALPENLKSFLNVYINDLKDVFGEMDTVLAGETISIDDLKAFANRLDAKAQEYLAKIEADLSTSELAEIELRKELEASRFAEQKQQLEQRLSEAENSAREYLLKLKEERKEMVA